DAADLSAGLRSGGTATPISIGGPAAASSVQQSGWAPTRARSNADVYVEMAADFSEAIVSGFVAGDDVTRDPALRFPVLLHWSFTSFGNVTFRSLVEGLDSGLFGTVPASGGGNGGPGGGDGGDAVASPATPGRQPLEVVETGHVG